MSAGFLRHALRSLVYPGLDLHTRNRASLCGFWNSGPRDVFDAGSGNGYFSWLAYRSGARVIAANFEEAQVKKAREFLLGYKKADPDRLRFEHRNLSDLSSEDRTFDEVLCYETIEHIRRDTYSERQRTDWGVLSYIATRRVAALMRPIPAPSSASG
jgi:hypothetical protein